MTDKVIIIREGLLAYPNFPPASSRPSVFLAVERKRRREGHGDGLSHGARVELCIDIESKRCQRVSRRACQTGDAIVFLRIDPGDGEGVFEEKRIGHGCG